MKILILFLIISVAACTDSSEQHAQQFKKDASQKIKALASALKKELKTSMQSGGPLAAIDTCKLKAPMITQTLNSNDDLTIKRTSLKTRNPKNTPDAWEKQVLNSFEQKHSNGIPVKDLVYNEQIKSEHTTTFRMMRAIPAQGLCLSCHGDKQIMSTELVSKLEQAYPEDSATGYQVGDIRGAFSISRTIEN